jgi:hypothetical protein
MTFLSRARSVIFQRRFGQAFPGVRRFEFFHNPREARERLEILLQEPLVQNHRAPIWWWRNGDMQIETVRSLDEETLLLDEQELLLDWVAAVNAKSYYQQFVYVQTRASKPSGLYDYSKIAAEAVTEGFAREEFGLYQGHFIKRAEYDDGAAIINGRPVTFESTPELRVRYLTPFNLLIAPQDSPINNSDFDDERDAILNRMLRAETGIDELVEAVLKLPKRPTV